MIVCVANDVFVLSISQGFVTECCVCWFALSIGRCAGFRPTWLNRVIRQGGGGRKLLEMAIYCHAEIGSAGLANRLYPWARCEVFARRHQLPVIAPQWLRFKLGPFLRGERDKRLYTGLFKDDGYISGLQRKWLLFRGRVIHEADAESALAGLGSRSLSGIELIEFKDMDGFFGPIKAHREMLHRRLIDMLAAPLRSMYDRLPAERFIAVHVRRGDMPVLPAGTPRVDTNHGLPSAWFVKALRILRSKMDPSLPVRVYSDGTDDQIDEILKEPGVKRAPDQPSIVDILDMARAEAVIPSASSTFSAWSVFLGQMPSVWYPGRYYDAFRDDLPKMMLADPGGSFEPTSL